MKYFLAFILVLFMVPAQAEEGAYPPENADLSYGWQWRAAAGTSGESPFWIHSNRHGDFDRYSANTTLNLFGSWNRSFDSGISLHLGGNLLLRGADDSVIWFQEGYVRAAYRNYFLRAGRMREDRGLVHRELSMGTVDLSHNARPMPKISFGTVGFRPVPGTARVLHFDAALSHGWMDDTDYRYVEGTYLHQKHLYLRFFSEDAPVVPMGGIKHFAQWGGDSPRYGSMPSDLRSYRDVFFSLAPDGREIIGGGSLPNNFQNHVGSYDFALLLNIDRYRISLSRQFILEDTPNARFGTPFDGMWGATFELRPDSYTSWRGERNRDMDADHRPLLKAVHYAYLDTKEGISRYDHRSKTGYFNYYNHRTYRGGWTYYGRAIGNPLFFGDSDYLGVVNNIIIAHHFGAMGHVGPVDWKFFSTYSRNFGASGYRPREGVQIQRMNDRRDQWSFMLETRSVMFRPDLELGATIALDLGEVYDDNLGLMLSVRWTAN